MLGPRGVCWVARAAARPAEMDVAASAVHGAGALAPAPLCRKVAGGRAGGQASGGQKRALARSLALGTRSKIELLLALAARFYTASSFVARGCMCCQCVLKQRR